MNNDKWLIWSMEHEAWWGPNHREYFTLKSSAGRYTFDEACEIVRSANKYRGDNPNEAMILDA